MDQVFMAAAKVMVGAAKDEPALERTINFVYEMGRWDGLMESLRGPKPVPPPEEYTMQEKISDEAVSE